MAAPQVTPAPTMATLVKMDGVSTCGYFNGDYNQPFTCSDTYTCTLIPFGSWWGCVNAVHNVLADACYDADNTEPFEVGVLNCPPSAPYCNTLYLTSNFIKMSTWTCGTSSGTLYLLNSYTGGSSGSNPATESLLSSASLSFSNSGSSNPQGPYAISTTVDAATTQSLVSAAPSSASTTQPSGSDSSSGASLATILGSVIGGVFALIVAIIGAYTLWKLAKRREKFDERLKNKEIKLQRLSQPSPASNQFHSNTSIVYNNGTYYNQAR